MASDYPSSGGWQVGVAHHAPTRTYSAAIDVILAGRRDPAASRRQQIVRKGLLRRKVNAAEATIGIMVAVVGNRRLSRHDFPLLGKQ